ncbi:olfactory receptor 187 [Xenopus laevis]|uniref:Olfactory receptor n=1 Tax=Xenopus laevis TaxID=8355 RepID=A0A8J0TPI6_XENLA|nr:olfactory receptor 187 [Xenopus laevis]
MKNQTAVFMLVLTGLSDLPSLQFPLFLVFLLIYLMTLTGNLIIFLLIIIDPHLHTPMYFFLGTLACVDMSYSSVTVPRMLFDLFTHKRVISVAVCRTQIYFFVFFCTSEVSLLAVMSCDRYIAICRPLHYMQIMNWKVCVWLLSLISVLSAVHSFLHTVFLSKITFCRSNTLQSFFCDLPQFLQISCSDTFINVLLIFLTGLLFGIGPLGVTFYPYFPIISTVLKIPSNQHDVQKLRERMGEVERRVSDMEDHIAPLPNCIIATEKQLAVLEKKANDLEKSRNNIRILGLPERAEGADTEKCVEQWLTSRFSQTTFSTAFMVGKSPQSAGQTPPLGAPPHPLIAQLLN